MLSLRNQCWYDRMLSAVLMISRHCLVWRKRSTESYSEQFNRVQKVAVRTHVSALLPNPSSLRKLKESLECSTFPPRGIDVSHMQITLLSQEYMMAYLSTAVPIASCLPDRVC